MTKLEVCCYSVDCAQIAEKAGADRVELCCGQSEGGDAECRRINAGQRNRDYPGSSDSSATWW